ncbi:MAG: serine hydrolase [Anaerolineales bacterium]|jgi:CubicO group peptidase (beta-lactamase class C family)
MNNKTSIWEKMLPALLAAFLGISSTFSLPFRSAAAPESTPPTTGLTDPDEIESFWDTFFAEGMETFGVHGAVMVMVKDGEIRFAKGYGNADADKQTPIDPEATILRTGSIAKTVTATAIFQLAERGALDLDADVNQYLTRFQVPDTFPEPVTARHLINMVGGFDTRAVGIRAPSAAELRPLGEYLAERMPPRVLPPGRYRRYNDHEIALAGYLVEVVSGMPYEAYIRQHIFDPLGMGSSSILLPDEQLPMAARGYPVGGGPQDAYPLNYYYLNDAPGAGFNTTALDMGHYLLAHLQNGATTPGDGTVVRILAEETAREMHATAYTYHPRLAGQANSFDGQFYNGHRYLRKLGGAPGMQNNLLLLFDQDMGFYLFYNSEGTALRNRWTDEVLKMYLSQPATFSVGSKTIADKDIELASSYTGTYQQVSDSTSETTIVQVRALFNPDLWVQVEAYPDGSLEIWGRRYEQIEPGLFRSADSGRLVAFERGADGEAGFLFDQRTPFQRTSWIESPKVQLGLLVFSVLVFLFGAIAGLVALLRGGGSSYTLPTLVSGLNLTFLVALILVLMPVITGGDIWQFSFEPSMMLRIVLVLPLIGIILAAGLLVQTATAWWTQDASLALRLQSSLVLLAVGTFVYFLHTWNLLGWRF